MKRRLDSTPGPGHSLSLPEQSRLFFNSVECDACKQPIQEEKTRVSRPDHSIRTFSALFILTNIRGAIDRRCENNQSSPLFIYAIRDLLAGQV